MANGECPANFTEPQNNCNYHDIFGVIATRHDIGRNFVLCSSFTAPIVCWFVGKCTVEIIVALSFYRRPVRVSGYFCYLRLRVRVCVCVCVSLCQLQTCPRHNSSLHQARITKFGPGGEPTKVVANAITFEMQWGKFNEVKYLDPLTLVLYTWPRLKYVSEILISWNISLLRHTSYAISTTIV